MLVGNSHLVKNFQELVRRGKLAHGYIFFGEPGVGKFYFVKHLAYFLEEGKFEISRRPLQDSLVIDSAFGIDTMREVKNFLWQKPAISKKRLAIINDADSLTEEAQNAILKITEEPPEHAAVILIASQIDNLLPPLASRLQKIYFGIASDEELKLLGASKELLAAGYGRPGRIALLSRKDALFDQARRYAEQFLLASGKARSNLIKELVEAQKEAPKLIDYFFEELLVGLRQDAVKNAGLIRSVLHRLFLIKSYNTNKRLQIEAIA